MMRGIGASPSAHSSQATQATHAAQSDAFLSPMARQSNHVQRLLSTQLCDSLSTSQVVEEEPGAYKPKKKYNPKP